MVRRGVASMAAGLALVLGGANAASAQDVTPVDIRNYAYAPDPVSVLAGTTVMWTNNDSVAHTVTANDGSFDSGLMEPGQMFMLTVDTPGPIGYYCIPHGSPGSGMAAQIVVAGEMQAPQAAEQ